MGDVSKLPPKLRERLAARGILGQETAAAAPAPAGPQVLRNAGNGWVVVKDAAGKEYFWNQQTNETSWSAPDQPESDDEGELQYEDTLDMLSQFAGKIIGRKGAVLQELKQATQCDVHIPKNADQKERMLVRITGPKAGAVKKCKTVLRVMIGLNRTVEQAMMEVAGQQINWKAVHKQKDDAQQQDMHLDPEDAAALQWLRTFFQPDTVNKAIVSAADKAYGTPSIGAASRPPPAKRPRQDKLDPMNPENYEIDITGADQSVHRTGARPKGSGLIEGGD